MMRANTRMLMMTTTKTVTGNQLLKSCNQPASCFESEAEVLATAQLETMQSKMAETGDEQQLTALLSGGQPQHEGSGAGREMKIIN